MISKEVQYHDIGPVKRSISHIWDHLPILKFLWLRNHHTICSCSPGELNINRNVYQLYYLIYLIPLKDILCDIYIYILPRISWAIYISPRMWLIFSRMWLMEILKAPNLHNNVAQHNTTIFVVSHSCTVKPSMH